LSPGQHFKSTVARQLAGRYRIDYLPMMTSITTVPHNRDRELLK
jgi:hypothetical protein